MAATPTSKLAISRQTSREFAYSDSQTERRVEIPEVTKFRVQVPDKTFLRSLAVEWANSGAETELLSADDDSTDRRKGPFHCVHSHGQGANPTIVAGTWRNGTVHWANKTSVARARDRISKVSRPKEWKETAKKRVIVQKKSTQLDATGGELRGDRKTTTLATGSVTRSEESADGGRRYTIESVLSMKKRSTPSIGIEENSDPRSGEPRHGRKNFRGSASVSGSPSKFSQLEKSTRKSERTKKGSSSPSGDRREFSDKTGPVPKDESHDSEEVDLNRKGRQEVQDRESPITISLTPPRKPHKLTITRRRLRHPYQPGEEEINKADHLPQADNEPEKPRALNGSGSSICHKADGSHDESVDEKQGVLSVVEKPRRESFSGIPSKGGKAPEVELEESITKTSTTLSKSSQGADESLSKGKKPRKGRLLHERTKDGRFKKLPISNSAESDLKDSSNNEPTETKGFNRSNKLSVSSTADRDSRRRRRPISNLSQSSRDKPSVVTGSLITRGSAANSTTTDKDQMDQSLGTGLDTSQKTVSMERDAPAITKHRLRQLPAKGKKAGKYSNSEGASTNPGVSHSKSQVGVTTKSSRNATGRSESPTLDSGSFGSCSDLADGDVARNIPKNLSQDKSAPKISAMLKKPSQIDSSAEREQLQPSASIHNGTSCKCLLPGRRKCWRHAQIRAWWVTLVLLLLAIFHAKLLYRTEEMISTRHNRKWYEL